MSHTPVPWKVDRPHDPIYIFGPNMEMICEMRGVGMDLDAKANASLIVQAVNSRAALTAERDALREALKSIRDGSGPGCSHCECDDHLSPECCAKSECFCPTCIAGAALSPSDPTPQAHKVKHQDYCGCCGTDIPYGEWCLRCTAHLKPAERGLPMEDRTYFAQHGKDCPYQIKTEEE